MSSLAPTTNVLEAALLDLRAHYLTMPPVAAMGIEVAEFDGCGLTLTSPLALNVNDKGSAFGGSLTSLMTLAGWGLVTLQLKLRGLAAEVYVADSQVRYLAPLHEDLRARAQPTAAVEGSDAAAWQTFFATLAARGRARIQVQAQITLPDGSVATSLEGRYVAMIGK